MDINEYYKKLSSQSKSVFELTLSDFDKELSKSHYLCGCVFDFTEEIIRVNEEACALENAISQLESSLYCLTIGLYRQANSCLRLGFELALGSVQFSANKLEYLEWQIGKQDVKWHKLIDDENGVLSKRFCNVFYSDLVENTSVFNKRASSVYRILSEFVHGNNETWKKDGLQLTYHKDLASNFFKSFKEVFEIILFTLSMRYLKKLDLDNVDFIRTELSHIEVIRIHLGGPK